MKRAPKTKGVGWDVFHANGSSDNTDNLEEYYEIQRVDDPEQGACAFPSDLEAVRHVMALAKKGDEEAIDALWQAHADPVVHRVLWEG